MKKDPWAETLTSQCIFIPPKVAYEHDVNSGATGVLHFAAPLFDVVIQIWQQNPVQDKTCMQADMRIVFHVRAKLQKLQLCHGLV